ncbi:MAG: hypothetical protein IPJ65_07710 [Archangiaceae bacterium]|nr:hypothetical protein [Archangiaceae bacterium]
MTSHRSEATPPAAPTTPSVGTVPAAKLPDHGARAKAPGNVPAAHPSSATDVAARQSVAFGAPNGLWEAREATPKIDWVAKTGVSPISEDAFATQKAAQNLHVVGVTGFSGQWSQAAIDADPELAKTVSEAKQALRTQLLALKKEHGDKLVLSSGATMEGVPKLLYDVAHELGIKTMGVTAEAAGKYELAKMNYLIVGGEKFGAESPIFLRTSDEFILLGGGGQARKEGLAGAGLSPRPGTETPALNDRGFVDVYGMQLEGMRGTVMPDQLKKVCVLEGYGGSGDVLAASYRNLLDASGDPKPESPSEWALLKAVTLVPRSS